MEADRHKLNDRTWCYWATAPIEPKKMVSKGWSKILQTNISSEPQTLLPYQYFHVRSADFYATIKSELLECNNITWLEDTVMELNEKTENVSIVSQQHSWTSDRVFLSALPTFLKIKTEDSSRLKNTSQQREKKNELFFWQSFVGWRVKTKEKAFDESSMSMMDFNVPQQGNTQFVYELPFSATEALIEFTRFGKHILTQQEGEIELGKYLQTRKPYEILEVETGSIPMTMTYEAQKKHTNSKNRIIPIGTPGGAVKPTTGFAFKRMHAHAEEIAKALKFNKRIPTLSRSFRFRLYDVLLLQILANTPQHGKYIFEKLFRHQPIQRILKFLDERTKWWEELLIFSKLPIRIFLKSLIQYVLR